MSEAVKLNPLSVPAAIADALAKSVPEALARAKTALEDANIWSESKPIFANSTCNSPTCVAVKAVVAPNFLAESLNAFIASGVAPSPKTAFKLLIC